MSLSAHASDVISVLGSSGSGKSTLLRCMNLLEHPSVGRIFVNQTEIRMKQDKTGTLRPVACRSSCGAFAPDSRWCFSTSIYGRT